MQNYFHYLFFIPTFALRSRGTYLILTNMKAKNLIMALFIVATPFACKKDSGPVYCWSCIDAIGNETGTIYRDKTEKWANEHSGPNGICHGFQKVPCR